MTGGAPGEIQPPTPEEWVEAILSTVKTEDDD